MKKVVVRSIDVPRQQGFVLMEVLVSLVVIAIGLLGIAGLNAHAINNTSVARNRSIAAMHANSMSSSIGANESYWAKSLSAPMTVKVNGTSLNSVALSSLGAACSDTASSCSTAACNPDKMAACDLQQWGARLKADLPGGIGQVSCTGASPEVCTVTVSWWEKHVTVKSTSAANVATDVMQSYQTVVQP